MIPITHEQVIIRNVHNNDSLWQNKWHKVSFCDKLLPQPLGIWPQRLRTVDIGVTFTISQTNQQTLPAFARVFTAQFATIFITHISFTILASSEKLTGLTSNSADFDIIALTAEHSVLRQMFDLSYVFNTYHDKCIITQYDSETKCQGTTSPWYLLTTF